MGLSNAELDDFARSMARAEGRDSQEVTEENLVVSSTEAHWSRLEAHPKSGCFCESLLEPSSSSCRRFPLAKPVISIDMCMNQFTSCYTARAGRKSAIKGGSNGTQATSYTRRPGSGIDTTPTTGSTSR